MLIKIHNKYYDISDFIQEHPGGSKILASCEGLDATAAFESYHSLADINKIKSIMKKYECSNPEYEIESQDFTFLESGFYNNLREKVRNHFKNKNTKWTYPWLGYFTTTFTVYASTFLYTFLGTEQPFAYRAITSFIAGTALLSSMFQLFHDASHSAISKNKEINNNLSLVGASLLFWDSNIWIKHHSVLHHSYTGNYKLDPDLRYSHPLFKKHPKSKANIITNYTAFPMLLSVFPGMHFGQVLVYLYSQIKKKYLCYSISERKTLIEWIIILSQMSMMYYGNSLLLVIIFLLSGNINYSIAILPDHDQLETRLNSEIDSEIDSENNKKIITKDWGKTKDWGEQQVRHSGNFGTNNLFYTRLYGGINYQIEHHLFPSVCSYHLPEISKIVKETCAEYDIKYISNPSIMGAYWSAINNLYQINNPKKSE
jgi:linoleoyl-CoA desaturase